MEWSRMEYVAAIKGREEWAWRWSSERGTAVRDLETLRSEGHEAHIIIRQVTIGAWSPA